MSGEQTEGWPGWLVHSNRSGQGAPPSGEQDGRQR